VLKIVETFQTPLGSSHHAALPRRLAGEEGASCSLPRTASLLSTFGLDFRPLGLIR